MGDRRGVAGQEVVSSRGGVPRWELGSQPEEPGEKAHRPGWSRGLQGGERLDGPAGRGLALSSLQTRLRSPGTARQLPRRPRVAGLELSKDALSLPRSPRLQPPSSLRTEVAGLNASQWVSPHSWGFRATSTLPGRLPDSAVPWLFLCDLQKLAAKYLLALCNVLRGLCGQGQLSCPAIHQHKIAAQLSKEWAAG